MEPMARAFLMGLERSNLFIGFFTRDLTGEEWLQRPAGVPNCALWTMGHLAHQRGRFLEMLTGRPCCEEGWGALFDLGSPASEADACPDLDSCRRVLDARLQDLRTWLEAATRKDLESPCAAPSDFFPSKASALTHLTHHEAHHTGCLSMVRRLLGKEKVA